MAIQGKSKKIKKPKKPAFKFDLEDYELNDTDKTVFQYKKTYPELTQNQIAKLLGLSFERVSRIVHKPAYQLAEKNYNKSWIDTILDARKKAADKIISNINSKDPRIQQRAAEYVLQLEKYNLDENLKSITPITVNIVRDND